VVLKNSAGTTIWTLDNVKAALDTSSFLTDSDIAPSFPITNTSSNQSLVAADSGKFYNVNCSGGDVTVTFDDSPTLGNGWNVKVRHDGTANQISFIADGSEVFKIGSHAGVSRFASTHRGQSYTVVCDGTGFKVEQSSPALFNTTGVILVADRLSAPPSAEAGARYIVGSAPSGLWSTFAEYDIAEYTGAGWINITPPTNSGWVAYVQDEARHYFHYTSGWDLQVNKQGSEYFVTSGTITASATLDLTIPTDADELEIRLWGIVPATDNTDLHMRFSQSSSFLSGASDYQWSSVPNAGPATDLADSEIQILGGLGTATNERCTVVITIFKPNAASTTKAAVWKGGARLQDAAAYIVNGWGELILNSNAIDGVRFLMSSGNITSGNYAVLARRYS
jgi:hypothetical protein